jgi:hypothetical protein
MNMTTSTFLSWNVLREIVRPETTSGKEKLGALVPSSSMVEEVAAITYG